MSEETTTQLPPAAAREARLVTLLDKLDAEPDEPSEEPTEEAAAEGTEADATEPAPEKAEPAKAAAEPEPKPSEEDDKRVKQFERLSRMEKEARQRDYELRSIEAQLVQRERALEEKAAKAARLEAALDNPAELLDLIEERVPHDVLAKHFMQMNSPEARSVAKLQKQVMSETAQLKQQLDALRQERELAEQSARMRSAQEAEERALVGHLQAQKAKFPLLAKMPERKLIDAADRIAAMKFETYRGMSIEEIRDSILADVNDEVQSLAAIFAPENSGQSAATENPGVRKPTARAVTNDIVGEAGVTEKRRLPRAERLAQLMEKYDD